MSPGCDRSPSLGQYLRVDQNLRNYVIETFGGDANDVLVLLGRYGSDPSHQEVDRVQRAIVSLSGNDIGQVRHNVDAAVRDYRDVLMWAEYPPDQDEPKSYEEMRSRLRDSPGGPPPVY